MEKREMGKKVKGKAGRPKGRETAKYLRGVQGLYCQGGETALKEADEPLIIEELRHFTPMCMIAAKLNVSRHTLINYVHSHAHLEQELKDRDEAMIDLTARSIFDASIGKHPIGANGKPSPISVPAAIFLLERKARDRGYAQHIEIEAAAVPSFTFNRSTSIIQPEPPATDSE
jgi:hypothetical protein